MSEKTVSATWRIGLAALLWVAATGCNEEFEAFTTVSGLRVLGVSATQPDLQSGETASFSALVTAKPDTDITYRWSWCPFSTGTAGGYECAITQQQFNSALSAVGVDPVDAFPPFDMGSEPEASFHYGLSAALLRTLCELAFTQSIPAFVSLPECDRSFPVTVALEVSDGNDSVQAVKKINLIIGEDVELNINPEIGADITATDKDGRTVVLAADGPSRLTASRTWTLRVDVPESAAQSFTPSPDGYDPSPDPIREVLFMTWFVEKGEMKFSRTGFYDGSTPFEDLLNNDWYTPSASDAPNPVYLYWVLQDERGGVAWTSREIILEVAK